MYSASASSAKAPRMRAKPHFRTISENACASPSSRRSAPADRVSWRNHALHGRNASPIPIDDGIDGHARLLMRCGLTDSTQLTTRPKQTFVGRPTNACLDFFVFAEFYRQTGKTTLANSGWCNLRSGICSCGIVAVDALSAPGGADSANQASMFFDQEEPR